MQDVIDNIRQKLTEMESHTYAQDYTDLGNYIGIAVGECADKDQIEGFESGFEHGISLTDGTHP